MHQTENDKRALSVGLWLAALVCLAAVIFALCGGVAFSAIRESRLAAAKAGIGQIEAVLYLAERTAELNGLGPAPTEYGDMLKSYDQASQIELGDYEKYVLTAMLATFGPARDFDFGVVRQRDVSGVQLQVFYFPVKGRTDVSKDRYYSMRGGQVVEVNG